MKTAIITCLLLVSSFTFSQNITFDQAQNLRNKSLAEVEMFLTTKGWSMTVAEEGTSDKMGIASFGYNVDQFDSEKATGWITFYESSISNKYNRLRIQVHKPNLYTTFLTRLKANSYILISSKIEDGGIKKVYKNTTTTCVVTTATSEGTFSKSTTYSFFFIDTLNYKIYYEDDNNGVTN